MLRPNFWLGLILLSAVPQAEGKPIYGINGNASTLFVIDSETGLGTHVGTVNFGGGFPKALEFRPATGELYVVAGGSPNEGNLYTVDLTTATPTLVSSSASLSSGSSNEIGLSFNPVSDTLRFITENGANRHISPSVGATSVVDTGPFYVAGDPNAGQTPNIAAIAHTNKFDGASSTTLYGIDSDLDILVRVGSLGGTPSNPATGELTTVGPLGVDFNPLTGFDIDNQGNAYLSRGGFNELYSVDLSTGAASFLFNVPPPSGTPSPSGFSIRGIAFVTGAGPTVTPEPSTMVLCTVVGVVALAYAGYRKAKSAIQT